MHFFFFFRVPQIISRRIRVCACRKWRRKSVWPTSRSLPPDMIGRINERKKASLNDTQIRNKLLGNETRKVPSHFRCQSWKMEMKRNFHTVTRGSDIFSSSAKIRNVLNRRHKRTDVPVAPCAHVSVPANAPVGLYDDFGGKCTVVVLHVVRIMKSSGATQTREGRRSHFNDKRFAENALARMVWFSDSRRKRVDYSPGPLSLGSRTSRFNRSEKMCRRVCLYRRKHVYELPHSFSSSHTTTLF